jgi:hypothetical protein
MMDHDRVRVITEAITYSRRFAGSWFVVHASPGSIDPMAVSSDILLLRSLGIRVAVVVPEPAYPELDALAVDLRKALNRDDLTAVVLHWEETRAEDVPRQRTRRWQAVGESAALVIVVRCAAESSREAALTLAVECDAAKLLLLEPDWNPAALPVGGPGQPAPSADEVRPYLPGLGSGSAAAAAALAVGAVEAGLSEVHIVPAAGNPNPILLEIFTEAGIGTWIGG